MSTLRKPLDDTRKLQMEMDVSAAVVEQLKALAAGDEEFLADLVEGETGIFEIIARVDASELEDRTIIAGLEATIKTLQDRKRRAEARAETKRSLIASVLHQLGLRSHKTPLGTISLSDKAPVAVVTEESEIPTRFWVAKAPTLDKAALNTAMRARDKAVRAASEISDERERAAALRAVATEYPSIPGATLSNGGLTITIRR